MEHTVFLSEPRWFFLYAGVFVGLVVWSAPWVRLVSRLFLGRLSAPGIYSLLICPACFGFWFGAIAYALTYHSFAFLGDALASGALTALVASATYRLLNWLLEG